MNTTDNLGNVFSNALMEAIATTTSVHLDDVSSETGDACFFELTGVMSLCSKKGGILFITAKESDMRTLCSYMTGISLEEVTKEDAEDTLCEFVNMTAGSVKLRLSDPDYMFTLSTPFVIKGKDIAVATKSKTHVISIILGNGEISVKLLFIC